MTIEKRDEQIIFGFDGCEYELRSHPYEPCLYICQNGEIVKVLHNAFDAYDLPEIFASGETVRSIDGKDINEETFCRVLIAARNDRRYEMDWTFAARLAASGTR